MEENKFTKEQLIKSERFKEYKDVLSAFLKQGESYSLEETQKVICNFLNKRGE